MAHLIDMSNGRANMAYVGETPWHGLGQALTDGASLDQWRVEAGLNWEAKRNALYYRDETKEVRKSASEVLYRSDSGEELGIVSPSYKIVQPREVMEFFRDLTEQYGFKMETAGSLDGGRKAWALARTGQEFRLMGTDAVKAYVLLATSFDGTLATRAGFVATRVVCNNTLQIGLKEKSTIAVSHSTDFNATQVKIKMGLLEDAFSNFEGNARELANRKVGKADALNYLLDILADGEHDVTKLSTRKQNIVQNVYQLWAGSGIGAGYAAANGTAWGLVNAVTQYVDHIQGNNVNNRFRSAQFGLGADLKVEAFQAAMKLVA
jgi:phage/plasmid-like protein (TIGR03299 family)